MSEEKIGHISSVVYKYGNKLLMDMQHLYLINNVFDSLKFGLSLWLLTYIGSFFNTLTIIILAWTGLFTIPKVNYMLRECAKVSRLGLYASEVFPRDLILFFESGTTVIFI